jgi:hypothetical protein
VSSSKRTERILFCFQKESGEAFEVKEVTIKPSDYHYTQKHYEIVSEGNVVVTVGRAEELLNRIGEFQ